MVIGDLGLARNKDSIRSSSRGAGTIYYMSPETHNNQTVEKASDIWYFRIKLENSIGIFFYFILLKGHLVVYFMSYLN